MSQDSAQSHYVGRFAPSPTGPLHIGSLLAAVASYLDARAHHGRWLVRMEDLDPPREIPGAQDEILKALEAHGLNWDDAVVCQSKRAELYEKALAKLADMGCVYRCRCTRRQLQGGIYRGTCRNRNVPAEEAHSIRIRVPSGQIAFTDLNFGRVSQDLAAQLGDFIVRRRDGLHAYQLAVVVDDHEQKITHVVRGADLLDNTPRQIYLQQVLGCATPAYLHVPVISNANGIKLSKQSGAVALHPGQSGGNLENVMRKLGHPPPSTLRGADVSELLHWGAMQWRRKRLPTHLDPEG